MAFFMFLIPHISQWKTICNFLNFLKGIHESTRTPSNVGSLPSNTDPAQ